MKLKNAITAYEAAGNADYSKLLKEMDNSGTAELLFIVIAMNRDEAQELLDEDAAIVDFLNKPQLKRFQNFKVAFRQEFDNAATVEWLKHYQVHREDWRPHLYPPIEENSIVRLIEQESIKQYTRIKEARMSLKQHFWPDFVKTDDFFPRTDGNNQGDWLNTWRGMKSRSVLLIDGFSLFHPRIQQVLEASSFLSINDPVGALILSPLREAVPLHPLEKTLEEMMSADMRRAFARFSQDFDPLYAFHLNSKRRLKRWLFTSIGHLILTEPSANQDNIERVQEESSGRGIGRFVAGGPG